MSPSLIAALSLVSTAFRLPSTGDFTRPQHYDLSFQVVPADGVFSGEEAIRVDVAGRPSAVVLHAVDLDLGSATVEQAGQSVSVQVVAHPDTETVELKPARPLSPGSAVVRLSFKAKLREDLRGLYLVKRPNGDRYAVSQFESTDARRAFPCYDEPGIKATFSIRATVPSELVAISNGAAHRDEPVDGTPSLHTLTFDDTPLISSYLVALAVGNFAAIEGDATGTKSQVHLRVLAPRGQEQLGRFALGLAKELLPFYESYFGVPYPFAKLDMVAVPEFDAGGMENAGAIFYRDNRLLLDEKSASAENKRKIFVYVSHELAHQWFGDLVTMAWWDDLWLNEAFASLMEGVSLEALHPEWSPWSEFRLSLQAALDIDALTATHPIHVPVATADEADALFDDITYSKGAGVLRMLQLYFTPKLWQAGVHDYLAAHAFANASEVDLWRAISSATGKDASRVAASWFDQPGFPLLTAHLEGTKIRLSQTQFVARGDAPSDARWLIPVCFSFPKGKMVAEQCTLFEATTGEEELAAVPGWLDANAHQAGCYRVSYDEAGWAALTTAFGKQTLEPSERMALLADAFALAVTGKQPLDHALNLVSKLGGERDEMVWDFLSGSSCPGNLHCGALQKLDDSLADESQRTQLRRWLARVMRPAADDLGWVTSTQDSPARRTLRSRVFDGLLNLSDDPRSVQQARDRFAEFERHPQSLDPGLIQVVLKSVARHGDAQLWEHLRAAMAQSEVPEERENYRVALAEFTDPKLVKKTLDLIASGGFKQQDVPKELGRMLSNRASQDATLEFVLGRWRELRDHYFGFSANQLLLPALGSLCSLPIRDRLQQFFSDPLNRVDGSDRVISQALERIALCAQYQDAHQAQLARWLKKHGDARK